MREAATRKAAAVVIFSTREEAPFLYLQDDGIDTFPDIPTIVIGRRSADALFAAAGVELGRALEEWKSSSAPKPSELIARLDLHVNGAFTKMEGPSFTLMFEPDIAPDRIEALATINEKSVAFIVDLFKPAHVTWRKAFITYFQDFDSKLFYTHHWGSGLSSGAGVFSVLKPSTANFGLAVHENTHTLLHDNWGNSSSFFIEGLGRYAEAMATTADRDHVQAARFLRASALFPLAQMVELRIGPDARTEIAYPAAGSFVGYLIATYGLESVRRAYELEGARESAAPIRQDSWMIAFKHSLAELEHTWVEWLTARFMER